MKNYYYFILTAILVIIYSCQKVYTDTSNTMEHLSNAENLIMSNEYRDFLLEIQSLAKDIRQNYIELSNEKRKDFRRLNQKISDQIDSKSCIMLLDSLKGVIGIDYNSRLRKIDELGLKALKKRKVPVHELAIALRKRNFRHPRTKTSEEKDPYQLCLDTCTDKYTLAITACFNAFNAAMERGNENAEEEHIRCTAYASSDYNDCNVDCLQYKEVQ